MLEDHFEYKCGAISKRKCDILKELNEASQTKKMIQ